MQIIDFGPDVAEPVDAFASHGAAFVRLADSLGKVHLDCMYLGPQSVLGRHPTSRVQLFCVVQGEGTVSGEDEIEHPIRTGQAALWLAGEHHETKSQSGLVAIIVQADPVIEIDPNRVPREL